MAELRRTGNDLALVFEETEAKTLGLKEKSEYQIHRAKNGLFVMIEQESQNQKTDEKLHALDEKLFALIEESDLSCRVEGKFEQMLEPEMRKRFEELVKQGLIIKFKLNPTYAKAVYKTKKEMEKKPSIAEKKDVKKFEENIGDYSLEKNGYIVIKNETRAKRISEDLSEQIKSGQVKGIKSFDSCYYILQSQLYLELREKLIKLMATKKEWKIQEIEQETKLSKDLIKGVLEFLKEEGDAIEKRKELYLLV